MSRVSTRRVRHAYSGERSAELTARGANLIEYGAELSVHGANRGKPRVELRAQRAERGKPCAELRVRSANHRKRGAKWGCVGVQRRESSPSKSRAHASERPLRRGKTCLRRGQIAWRGAASSRAYVAQGSNGICTRKTTVRRGRDIPAHCQNVVAHFPSEVASGSNGTKTFPSDTVHFPNGFASG